MKRTVIFFVALALGFQLFAQGKELSAFFNHSTFYLPAQQQPYIETYLSLDAWSLNFQPIGNNQYAAVVEVVLIAKQGDSIAYVKKYDLRSPAIYDTAKTDFNFIDVQRFGLKNGIYDLEVTLHDKYSTDAPVKVSQKISIFYDKKKPALSSVQFIASAKKTTVENILSRNGFDMEPYVSDFVPQQCTQLSFYYELYNIDQEIGSHPFLAYAYIEEQNTGKRQGNIFSTSRHESSNLVPKFTSLDISELPSGNYNLVVEIHDRNNDLLLYKKTPFFRSNPMTSSIDNEPFIANTFVAKLTDENQLRYYIDALYPIASDRELAVIKDLNKRTNLEEKQVFFYNFWSDRDALNPESKWLEYRTRLEYVDQNFSYPKTPGYRSDRGRVYLQYGPPDFIRDEKNFVGALHIGSGTNYVQPNQNVNLGHIYYLPYQLWRYNKLEKDDANRVFLFWDDMRSGYYKLLVSNARGETWDPLWERRLSQQQLEEYVEGEVGEQFRRGY